MNTKHLTATIRTLAALAGLGLASLAHGQQIIQDNFTGTSTSFNWTPFLGACLTAGNNTGTIPACVGDPYYTETLVGGNTGTMPDTAPNGALRFTNGSPGGFNQAGAIISNFTFPSSQGLQVTFTTVTYRGNSGGGTSTATGGYNLHDGADGISFFLMDGSYAPYDVGAFGGSLGYTCSNVNNDAKLHPLDGTTRHYDGLAGGYIGLGIDEYGNFLNGTADNTATGFGFQGNRIGLRGAGSISWMSLNATWPLYYPSTLTDAQQAASVKATCKSGTLWDYSVPATPVNTGLTVANGVTLYDYPTIANGFKILPSTVTIANESATKRPQATPITYKLKITQAGLLSLQYSYNGGAFQSVITNQNITAGNGPLPATFRFGFAGSTGGATNIHEVMCFQASPADTASSSAGLNEKQTARVQTGSQVYFAFYNPNNWSGSLTAQNLVIDPVTNLVSISAIANWDASCVLTGLDASSTCIATGVQGPAAAEAPTARAILSWDGSAGIPFQYSNLSAAQQTAITAGDASPTANRVNFLRGDRTNEQNALGVGLYRQRASVLGDIVNSSPTWVGGPSSPFKTLGPDLLHPATPAPEASGQSYAAYMATAGTRLNVVWSGANDGLMHGFRSGSYAADGTYVTSGATPNDGQEVMAYMPGTVVSAIHSNTDATVDYSNPQYGHQFFVDAPPGTGDLYYGGAWHTWLVGGLGAGGAALYALDVTDPTSYSESNAASLVMGEWNSTTLNCTNVANCKKNLGNTYGVPQIRRLHNGMWGVIFGNGFGSVSGDAGIYVMTIDPVTAAKTFYYLSTGKVGTNGIAYTTPADLDGDHITDYVYAGDLLGNVWRFDLTSSNPGSWAVTPGPLFTTPAGQPITTKVVVAASSSTAGTPRVVVSFGTGRQFPLTNTTPSSYATGTQALYGVWDWNLGAWNAMSSSQYASLTGSHTFSISALQQQTVLASVPDSSGFRAVSNNGICWFGGNKCATNTQFGWYLNLPASGEQVIYSPVLQVGAFIVNTTIPPNTNALSCTPANPTGWTMAINPITGGSFTKSFFGDSNGHFVNYNGQVVSGLALSGTGSVSIVTTSGTSTGTFLVTQTTSGVGVVKPINPLATAKGSRLTWVELR
ncbi:MAG TPA: PilC/PilY family type IV pilus protein [Steroidobacteraceae bacterium]|nr:PilC/PilY family type IV pilus protein [Steroidobacteraceae bacterium]